VDGGARGVTPRGEGARTGTAAVVPAAEETSVPDTVTLQLDAVGELVGQLTGLGAELSADAAQLAEDGARLGRALDGPAAAELTGTGRVAAGAVGVLADRAGSVARTLALALESYRALEGLLTERLGAGRYAPTAR